MQAIPLDISRARTQEFPMEIRAVVTQNRRKSKNEPIFLFFRYFQKNRIHLKQNML